MDLLRKYLVPFYQTQEASAGTPEPNATPPAAVVSDAPPADPPQPEPDSPPPPSRANDPLISTITGLRGQKRDLEAELAQARKEAADARALADRLAAARPADPNAPQPPVPPRPPAIPTTDDAEIDRRAEYKLFVRDVKSMQEQGNREFGTSFIEAVRILEAVGATDDAFVGQVMAVDRQNAHKLLKQIAQDPQRAVELVNMEPARRIAEITRMAMAATNVSANATSAPAPAGGAAAAAPAPAAPAAKGVSKAPAPPPPIEPSASKEVDWRSDEASDDEFSRGFDEMMEKRYARGPHGIARRG